MGATGARSSRNSARCAPPWPHQPPPPGTVPFPETVNVPSRVLYDPRWHIHGLRWAVTARSNPRVDDLLRVLSGELLVRLRAIAAGLVRDRLHLAREQPEPRTRRAVRAEVAVLEVVQVHPGGPATVVADAVRPRRAERQHRPSVMVDMVPHHARCRTTPGAAPRPVPHHARCRTTASAGPAARPAPRITRI